MDFFFNYILPFLLPGLLLGVPALIFLVEDIKSRTPKAKRLAKQRYNAICKAEKELEEYKDTIFQEADKKLHSLSEEANMAEFMEMNDAGLEKEEYKKLYMEELRCNNPSFFDEKGKPTTDYFDWQDRNFLVIHEVGKELFDGECSVEINTDKPYRYLVTIKEWEKVVYPGKDDIAALRLIERIYRFLDTEDYRVVMGNDDLALAGYKTEEEIKFTKRLKAKQQMKAEAAPRRS